MVQHNKKDSIAPAPQSHHLLISTNIITDDNNNNINFINDLNSADTESNSKVTDFLSI